MRTQIGDSLADGSVEAVIGSAVSGANARITVLTGDANSIPVAADEHNREGQTTNNVIRVFDTVGQGVYGLQDRDAISAGDNHITAGIHVQLLEQVGGHVDSIMITRSANIVSHIDNPFFIFLFLLGTTIYYHILIIKSTSILNYLVVIRLNNGGR